MSQVTFGRTRDRSLLGTMNDYTFMARGVDARWQGSETTEALVGFLARTPILPLKGARPVDLTLDAFRGM